MIKHSVVVNAPIRRCFDLTRSIEFHQASSVGINAVAEKGRVSGLSELGDRTTWSARFLGFRFKLEMEVTEFVCDVAFSEKLVRGMPKSFTHNYRFREDDAGFVEVSDEMEVSSRFLFVGTAVDRMYLHSKISKLALERLEAIKRCAESQDWKNYLS